jgi:hypothetical protein
MSEKLSIKDTCSIVYLLFRIRAVGYRNDFQNSQSSVLRCGDGADFDEPNPEGQG